MNMASILSEIENKFTSKRIENIRTPEEAMEIISESECDKGLRELKKVFEILFPHPDEISVVPILKSGWRLGSELAESVGAELNPMRMSYYNNDASRLPKPVCLLQPDITKIVNVSGNTKAVVFAESVVDSQATVVAAMDEINKTIDAINAHLEEKLVYPEYYTFAYVSKTGESEVVIPNLFTAFEVHPEIWVGGRGCDLPGNMARENNNFVGILSPFAKSTPSEPYFRKNIF